MRVRGVRSSWEDVAEGGGLDPIQGCKLLGAGALLRQSLGCVCSTAHDAGQEAKEAQVVVVERLQRTDGRHDESGGGHTPTAWAHRQDHRSLWPSGLQQGGEARHVVAQSLHQGVPVLHGGGKVPRIGLAGLQVHPMRRAHRRQGHAGGAHKGGHRAVAIAIAIAGDLVQERHRHVQGVALQTLQRGAIRLVRRGRAGRQQTRRFANRRVRRGPTMLSVVSKQVSIMPAVLPLAFSTGA